MKNNLLYLMIFALSAFSLSSCDDESTAGMTDITYYAELILEGGTTLYLNKGDQFTDPGYSAIMNDEDVTDQVAVTSNLDMSKSGVYSISYSIANADGYSSSASRKVVVTDANSVIEGVYDTDPACYRFRDGVTTVYGSSYVILVFDNFDGTYTINDVFGGYYCQRANYGDSYSMEGTVSIANDGTMTMSHSFVPGWGDSANSMSDGMFDSAEGSMTWKLNYSKDPDMDFYVTMYKR